MKMYLYQAVEEKLWHEDIGEYTSYGIRALADGEEIAFISDVSTEREEVHKLAELFTAQELSPVHLHDAVEDFLENGRAALT